MVRFLLLSLLLLLLQNTPALGQRLVCPDGTCPQIQTQVAPRRSSVSRDLSQWPMVCEITVQGQQQGNMRVDAHGSGVLIHKSKAASVVLTAWHNLRDNPARHDHRPVSVQPREFHGRGPISRPRDTMPSASYCPALLPFQPRLWQTMRRRRVTSSH